MMRFSRASLQIGKRFLSTTKAPPATGVAVIDPTIGLSEEQLEFYNVARAFADNELRPFAAKWDEEHSFPLETYKKFGDLGFAGIFVRDDVGGTGLSRVDTVTIVEALATGCVGTTAMLTIHNMCAGMVDRFGTEEQRQRWLPSMCKLDTMASYCLTEPGSGSDAGSLSTKAKFDPATNEYVINGGKAFISGAGMSDIYLVMCRTSDKPGASGISCIVIPKDTKGVSFGAMEKKMGWHCQPTRQITFEDVRVPAANRYPLSSFTRFHIILRCSYYRLGNEGEGFKMAMAGLDGGRLSIASCSIGAAQACFEIALQYVKVNQSFHSNNTTITC